MQFSFQYLHACRSYHALDFPLAAYQLTNFWNPLLRRILSSLRSNLFGIENYCLLADTNYGDPLSSFGTISQLPAASLTVARSFKASFECCLKQKYLRDTFVGLVHQNSSLSTAPLSCVWST